MYPSKTSADIDACSLQMDNGDNNEVSTCKYLQSALSR